MTMKAVRFTVPGAPPVVETVPIPTPGPGQVLVRIGGAGGCHSDLHVLDHGALGFHGPFTLGHENAGWVAALGAGVSGWKEGDPVAVYGFWGCGHCHACLLSMESYCENAEHLPNNGGGIGTDGGMAEYMLVPSPRLLVPLGTLAPRDAAPLTDAALTPYHAKFFAHDLAQSLLVHVQVLVGVGGLGHMAVQLLRVLCGARVVAVDLDERKLEHARQLGADLTVNSRNAAEAAETINAFTGRRKAAMVLDFVGIFDKLEKALAFDSDEINAIVKDLKLLKVLFKNKMESKAPDYLGLIEQQFNDKDVDTLIEHFRDPDGVRTAIDFKEHLANKTLRKKNARTVFDGVTTPEGQPGTVGFS